MHISNEKGRLYSGMQDRKYQDKREYARPIEDLHLPMSLAAWGKNQPTIYINMNEITMKHKLLQQCIIVSCKILAMLPSSPPQHQPRGRQLGANSLIVIVSSSNIWLQHKASCYRGHGYS